MFDIESIVLKMTQKFEKPKIKDEKLNITKFLENFMEFPIKFLRLMFYKTSYSKEDSMKAFK